MTHLGMGLGIEDISPHETLELDALANLIHKDIRKKDRVSFEKHWNEFVLAWENGGQETSKPNDAYDFRRAALRHFCKELTPFVFNSIPCGSSGDDIISVLENFIESEDYSGVSEGNDLSPEAFAFALKRQREHPYEEIFYRESCRHRGTTGNHVKKSLYEAAVQVMGSPLREHAPWRRALRKILPALYKSVLESPQGMADILSQWGRRSRDALNLDDNLDRAYIEELIPHMRKAWPELLHAHRHSGYKEQLSLQNPLMWNALCDAFPQLRDSLNDFFDTAKKQNERRWGIVQEQWPKGMTKQDLRELCNVDIHKTPWHTYGEQTNGYYSSATNIPPWFVHFFIPRIPENHIFWKEKNLQPLPDRMHTSLAESFLYKSSGRRVYENFIEKHPDKAEYLITFDNAPFIMNYVCTNRQDEFMQKVKTGLFSHWRMGHMTLGHYYVTRHCTSSLAFAQTLYREEPSWFEDGTLIQLMRKNGMTRDNEAKFSQANLKRTLKSEGVKIATKATKKARRLM